MLDVIPDDYIRELICYDAYIFAQTCKSYNCIYKQRYNELLKRDYVIIVKNNTLDNPYKIYKILHKIYNGKFYIDIGMIQQVIKLCIEEEHIELFDILCKTMPSTVKNCKAELCFLAVDKGLFYIACILLKNYCRLDMITCEYTYVKNYYLYKTKPYANEFIQVLIDKKGFENAIIYYSLYHGDEYYKLVLNEQFLDNAMCNATMMGNVNALKYMIANFTVVSIIDNLFNYNVHKNEESYKLIIDHTSCNKASMSKYLKSDTYNEIIRLKIISYMDHSTHFNNKGLHKENRLATIDKMCNKPIPTAVFEYLAA